jgi:glutaredoxin-like YruB-family protein
MKMYAYIIDRGGKVSLTSIGAPTATWKSPIAVFEHTYNHEKKVTQMIDSLVDLSISEKDHATKAFLQWYVNEQVEEEASASEIWESLKMIGASKNGLMMLDKKLGEKKKKKMAKVKVYSTPTCPWCHKVKEHLKEKNIEFEDIDVSQNHEAAHEMVDKSGQMGVPVVDIDGKIIVGFDQAEIDKAIGAS